MVELYLHVAPDPSDLMNLLVSSLFVSVFLTGYLAQRLEVIPAVFSLVPELLTGIAVIVVLGRVISSQSVKLDWRYSTFLIAFFFILTFGFLAQSVPTGAIVAGLRNYVKFIPFFLLPLAYRFTPRQLKTQLIVLLVILLMQSPLAVYQRFVQFAHQMHTGDPVRGMATSSSALSMLMACAVALLVSLYLRGRMRLPLLLFAVAVLVLPTALNETKGTLIMLPIAFLAPALFMPRGSKPMRKLIAIAGIGVLALGAFIAGYNILIQNREGGRQIEAFFSEGRYETYLYTGAADGADRFIGRFDSVAFAIRGISGDPLKMTFGLGAGNVSKSSIPGFDGEYASFYDRYGVNVTQVSSFLWEIGLAGLLAFIFLYWIVFRDARFLARSSSSSAIYGQVWATIIIMMTLALMYKSVLAMNEIAYLFWFYSGVVSREAYEQRRLRHAKRLPHTESEGAQSRNGRRRLAWQGN
jgi:hypothetical protein